MRQYIIILLVLTVSVMRSQEPTDKEIGFDRELLRKELYDNNPFIKRDFLDGQLEKLREDAVSRYKLGRDEWFKTQLPPTTANKGPLTTFGFTSCETGTFNADITNPLASNWLLTYNVDPYAYNDNNNQSTNSATGASLIINNETRFLAGLNIPDAYLGHEELEGEGGVIPPTRYLKIGNERNGTRREQISRTFTLNSESDFIFYRFAIVLQDPSHTSRPFFSIRMYINDELVNCSVINYEAPQTNSTETVPGFIRIPNTFVWVRPWSANVIKPSDFNANVNDEIKIEVSVSDCGMGGHFGYGYFDIECINEDQLILASSEETCKGAITQFQSGIELVQPGYEWNIKDSNNDIVAGPFNTPALEYAFNQVGNYKISLSIPYFTTSENCNIVSTFEKPITVTTCPPPPCVDCASYSPIKNEKYIISGWVKEIKDSSGAQFRKYDSSFIGISFYDPSQNIINTELKFYASGKIIDGWQRITGEFTVPPTVDKMHIRLSNKGAGITSYFDDIRVNPINGNMKSFVYDQETQKLMAELDENNYSTFYEYDNEGGLIRVKKETEKGIFTIQESRSANPKN